MRAPSLFTTRCTLLPVGVALLAIASPLAGGCFGSDSGPADGGAFDGSLGDALTEGGVPDAADGATTPEVDGGGDGAASDAAALDGARTDGAASPPPGALQVLAAGVGASNMCVVLPDHTVECCGYNAQGELGNGSTTSVDALGPVPGLTGVTAVASSGLTVCALLADATASCWGNNYEGELGIGNVTTLNVPTPTAVPGLSGVTALAMGGNHTCALLSGGTVDCWGENFYGELGNATTSGPDTSTGGVPCNPSPAPVTGIRGATALSAGDTHTCAVLADRTVACWGADGSGQLGDGQTQNSGTPVPVSGVTNAVAVACGGQHTCALLGDGTVSCWGQGTNGQLGDGMSASSASPVAVAGLTNVKAVGAGPGTQGDTTCALRGDGSVWCWGLNNAGMVGSGTMTTAPSPVQLAGIASATALSVGTNGACAVLSDGTLQCWGQNGLPESSLSPVTVSQ